MAGQQYVGIERYIFADTYNLFLKYKDMDNNDVNWSQCIADGNKLYDKYKGHPLARTIIVQVIDQISHIVCERELDGKTRYQWETLLKDSHKMGW